MKYRKYNTIKITNNKLLYYQATQKLTMQDIYTLNVSIQTSVEFEYFPQAIDTLGEFEAIA